MTSVRAKFVRGAFPVATESGRASLEGVALLRYWPPRRFGRLRALALSGDSRHVGVDVPTLREGGIDAVLHNWNGVFAPPGIEEPERARLDALVEAVARSPAWEREARQRRCSAGQRGLGE